MSDGTGGRETTRMEEFERELAGMRIRGASSGPEGVMLRVSVVLFVASIALILLGYWFVSGTAKVDEQNSYFAQLTFLGLGLGIIGVALYLRFGLARYLRYWLLRFVYEQRIQTDRVVEAIEALRDLDKDRDREHAADLG